MFSAGVQSQRVPQPFGLIHNDNFSSLGAWTQNGSAMSILSGKLRVNTTAGNHSNYILLSTPTAGAEMATHTLEKWVMSATFVCPAFASTAYGFGLGVRSTNGPEQFDNAVRIAFDHAQSNNMGDVYFYSDSNHSGSPNQSTDLASGAGIPVAGNTYIYEVERNKNILTAKLKNSTGGTLQTHTKTYNISTINTVRLHNKGQFCLWAYGGTFDITNVTITTNAIKYAHVMVLGDSNKQIYPGTNSARYYEQIASNLSLQIENVSGINAEITDMPLSMAIKMQPYVIVLATGSNDKSNGVSDTTRRTRLATAISTLNNVGYNANNIIIEIPPARNGKDIALIKSDTDSTYSNYTRADTYTATKNIANTNLATAANSGDDIHLSAAGNTLAVTPNQAAVQTLLP